MVELCSERCTFAAACSAVSPGLTRGSWPFLGGESQGAVWVVATKDRVAKLDGRFIHWVRGYGAGERYSLIFFATDPEHAVAPTGSAFPGFVPFG